MLYGFPEELSMGDEDEMLESEAGPEEDPEVQRLASEAFPGIEVSSSALKKLIRHCMDQYGPGAGEETEEEDEMMAPPGKGKELLLATFGKQDK